MIVFAIAGYNHNRLTERKKLWIFGLTSAFLIVTIAWSTFIIKEQLVRFQIGAIDSVNWFSYLAPTPLYSLAAVSFTSRFNVFFLSKFFDWLTRKNRLHSLVKEKARIGMLEAQVEKIFGHNYRSGLINGNEVWIYEEKPIFYSGSKINEDPAYAIEKGKIRTQLRIKWDNKRVIDYHLFHKGNDGSISEYHIGE